jgi:hypothetical protein
MPGYIAQRFRKLQHELFGLIENKWVALERLLILQDKMGIAVQREAWFEEEILAYSKLTNSLHQHERIPAVRQLREIVEPFRENVDICEKTEKDIRLAEEELRHTPIYRALYHLRKSKFWF